MGAYYVFSLEQPSVDTLRAMDLPTQIRIMWHNPSETPRVAKKFYFLMWSAAYGKSFEEVAWAEDMQCPLREASLVAASLPLDAHGWRLAATGDFLATFGALQAEIAGKVHPPSRAKTGGPLHPAKGDYLYLAASFGPQAEPDAENMLAWWQNAVAEKIRHSERKGWDMTKGFWEPCYHAQSLNKKYNFAIGAKFLSNEATLELPGIQCGRTPYSVHIDPFVKGLFKEAGESPRKAGKRQNPSRSFNFYVENPSKRPSGSDSAE